MEDFEQRVREVLYDTISKTMNVDKSTLTDATQPIKDLDTKSVNFVHIISTLEDEFELQVDFMPFRKQKTIGEMIEFMKDLYEG
jgi:Acyl carrier protein